MSKLDLVQLGSNPCRWQTLFPAWQQLGNTTTLGPMPSGMGVPVQVLGSGSANPIGVYDNRKERAMNLLLTFGVTTTNNSQVAFDVIGFSQVFVAGTATMVYLPTKFFLGEAQAGGAQMPTTSPGLANAFLCSSFDLKTFAGGNVGYIEPTDSVSAALMVIDIRGVDLVQIRLAQGATTAAAYTQVFWGTN